MKLTKSKLKQIIKEEVESLQKMPPLKIPPFNPVSRMGTPEWYSGEGRVADRLQEMAKEIRQELDEIQARLDVLEGVSPGSNPLGEGPLW